MATINMSGLIIGSSIKDLLEKTTNYDNQNNTSAQQVLMHNIENGIKNRKIEVLTVGTVKDSSQRQYTQNLIENAPELGQILTQYEQSLPQGYSVSYGFDPVKNRLHVFTKLSQSGTPVGDKPLTIELEDLTGNIGGKASKGKQILVVDHTSNGRTMAAPAGVIGFTKIVQALQSNATNYRQYLAAAASMERANPKDTRGINILLKKAGKSAGHRMRMATQAARPGETTIGSVAHPYKTQNPSSTLRTEQTLSYGHLIDDFFDMSWVKQLAKEAGQSVRELKNRIKINMLAGANVSHNIPKEIAKSAPFKQLASDLEAMAKAGVSIQELNDEAFGHGYVLGTPTSGARNYGYGRQKVQAENWANLTKAARQSRKKAGRGGISDGKAEENARYLVAIASAGTLREAGIKAATEEGGVYISEQMAEEMAREVTIQKKESVEEIEKIRQKRIAGAQKRVANLMKKVGGGAEAITVLGGKTFNLSSASDVSDLAKYYSENEALFGKKKITNAEKLAAVLAEQNSLSDAEEFAKEFVYARMTGQRMNLGRTDASRTGFSFERNGNVAKGLYTYDRKFQNSDKLVGDRVRDAAEVVGDSILQTIASSFGSGVKVDAAKVMGGSVKPRKASDFIFTVADNIVSYLNDNSNNLFGSNDEFKKAMDVAMKNGALSKLYKFNKETGRYEEDIEAFKKMQDNGEIEKYADALLSFFQNIHKFSDKLFKGLSGNVIEETRNILSGFTGNVKKTKNGYEFGSMLSYSRVNPMSMAPYGMPENTEAELDHRVQLATDNIARLAGVQNKIVQNAFSLSKEQLNLQEEQRKQLKKAVDSFGETNNLFGEALPSLGQYGERGGRITVGYGAQYDINLAGKEFSAAVYDDFGNITKESYEKSQLVYVLQELKKLVSQKLKKSEADITEEDLKNFQLFMDTNTNGVSGTFSTKTYGTDLGDGRIVTTTARAIPLYLTGMKDGRISQSDLAAWKLMEEVTDTAYLKNDSTQTPELSKIVAFNEAVDRAAMGYMAELFNPVYNGKSIEYAKSHKISAPNAFWGTNTASSFEEYKGKDLSTAYMSEEAARKMFEEEFSDEKDFARFAKFFEIATGAAGEFDNLSDGIKKLIEYMKDPEKMGVIGAGVRYPASTGQDLRFLNWKIDTGLEGTGIKLSRGMSTLLKGDFDGDRILSMVLGLGPGTDEGALKKLYSGDYKKLSSVTNRAVAALEQTLEKKEGEDEKTTLSSDTLKSWSNESINEINTLLVGTLKNWTGSLSNAFQAWADFAHKSGLDEMALSKESTEEERLMGARGILGRFLFSETTQQAISAKKISDKINTMGEEKWKSLTKEEKGAIVSDAVMAANDEIEALLETMKNPLLYSDGGQGKEVRDSFLKQLVGLGVADEKGKLDPRIQEMMLSTLYGMAGKGSKSQIAFFEKLFPELQGVLKPENLDRIDKNGNLIISKINRFVPTLEQIFDAFARIDKAIGGGVAKVMEAGRLDAQEVTSENAVLKMNFMEGLATDFKRRFNWDGSGQNGGNGGEFNGTINAQTVILNAKEVIGGSGGTFSRDTSLLTAKGMQIDPKYNPGGGYMNITNFAHSKVPHAYASGQNEQFWIDYEASGKNLDKMREMERYQGPAGEALIEAGRSGVSAIELGNLVHGILEGRDKGDEKKINKAYAEFDKKLGDLFSTEEISKFHDEAVKAADEIQAAYKRRGFESTASEADIGFTDPETGMLVAGRGDIFGLREYTDHYGNKQMELNVGDYKKLNGGKIGHFYGYQLMAEQYALAQMMANWDKLGFNASTTADDVNAIINAGSGDTYKLLQKLGYRKAKGEEGKEGYKPARTVDTNLFEMLKKLYYFYGEDADRAASHLTGTLYGHGSKGLMVREGINLFSAPQAVQQAFLSGDFENEAVKAWWDALLNPPNYTGSYKKAKDAKQYRDVKLSDGTVIQQQVSDIHGEETSLGAINQLLTRRLALEKEIALAIKEQEQLTKRVEAGDEDSAILLADTAVRRQELENERDSIEDEYNQEFNRLTPEAQSAQSFNAAIRERVNDSKIKVAMTNSDQEEQNNLAREYEKYLRERLAIESQLDKLQQRRNIAFTGRETIAIEAAIKAQQKKLQLVEQEGEAIRRNTNLRTKDKERLETDYQAERTVQQAQNATANHGIRNIWDMMGYDVKRSFAMIFDFGIAHRALSSLQMKIREVINTIMDLDTVMVDLRIVTGQTKDETNELVKSYNDLAKELGTTTKAIAEASNEWLRQGYSLQEVDDLIKSSTYLSKLGMIDSAQATEYLTSSLKGFKLEASEAMSIVDKLTALDMELATSAGEIAAAMSKTAVSAQLAGMDYDELAAAIGTVIDVSQAAPETVGNAMKTLLSRFGNVKAGAFVSMDEEGENGSVNDTEKVLNTIGISIRNSKSEFRSFSDVLDEVADKWITLSSVEKNAIATAMAGTRQREVFNTLMENYSTYEEMIKTSEESTGSAQKKWEAYEESIGYSIQKLAAAWEEFSMRLEASPAIKGMVDFATFLVEQLPRIIQYFSTWLGMLNAYKLPIWIKQLKDGFDVNKSTTFGRYKDIGIDKFWTVSGQKQRSAIREYEYYQSTGQTEKMKELEEQLPQGYRDKYISTTPVDSGTGQMISEQQQTNSHLANIESSLAVSLRSNVPSLMGKYGNAKKRYLKEELRLGRDGSFDIQNLNPNNKYAQEVAKTYREMRDVLDSCGTIQVRNNALASENLDTQNKTSQAQAQQVKYANEENTAESQGINLSQQERQQEEATALAQERQANAAQRENAAGTQKLTSGGVNSTLFATSKENGKAAGFLKGIGAFNKAAAIGGGITSAITGAASQEGNLGDKLISGAISGGLTALGTAFAGPIGGMIGSAIGSFLGPLVVNWIHAEEMARKERVEQAKAELEALQKLTSSTVEGMEIFSKNEEDKSAEDYQKQSEIVDSIKNYLHASDDESTDKINEAEAALELTDMFVEQLEGMGYSFGDVESNVDKANMAIEELSNNTDRASKVMTAFTAAQQKREALLLRASQEEERYKAEEEKSDALKRMKEYKEGSKEYKKAEEDYKIAQAKLDDMDEQVSLSYLDAAFTGSGVSSMSNFEIGNSALGTIRQKILSEWAKDVPSIMDSQGMFSQEAIAAVDKILRENGNFGSLFDSGNLTYGTVFDKKNNSERQDILNLLGVKDYEEAMELAASGSEEAIKIIEGAAEKLGLNIDELRNKIFNLDPANIEKFANALGMRVETVEKNLPYLENLDFEAVLNGLEGLNKRYSELGDIFADLAEDGKITQENMDKIVQNYSFLLKGENGISQDNIYKNIMDIMFGGANSESGLAYGSAIVKEAQSSKEKWKLFKDQYIKTDEDWEKIFNSEEGELTNEQLNILNSDDATYDKIFKSGLTMTEEGYEKWKQLMIETTGNLELVDKFKEQVVEMQKHTYEKQIENLESIRDALDDINEARKKELELIKAKDALENAKKEKKMVYREGIGWTYETDQTAVQEAKEKVDELETQKNQEDLQYKIDQLQSELDYLNNMEEEEQLREFKQIFEEWSEKVSSQLGEGENGSYLEQILRFFNNDFQNKLIGGLINAQQEESVAAQIQQEEFAVADLAKAKEEFDKAASNKFLDEKYKGSFEYKEAVDEYNKYLEKYQSAIESAKNNSGLSEEEIFDRIQSYNSHIENGDAGYEGLNKISISADKLKEDFNKILSFSKKEAEVKLSAGVANMGSWNNSYSAWTGMSNGTDLTNTGSEEYVLNGIFSEDDYNLVDDNMLEKQFGALKHTWFLPYNTDTQSYKGEEWQKLSDSEQYKDTIKTASDLTKLPKYTLILNLDWADYAAFVGSNGKLYKVYTNEGESKNPYEYNDGILNRYASGTTSAVGGSSLINELGTEGIITPQGTLTALPSKTGIVPADLTKNLYELGKVAPNLIRELDSLTFRYPERETNKTEDYSTNIGNLYATFQADDNFDFDKFLSDVRSTINITKHSI